jgi:hypothetical protein
MATIVKSKTSNKKYILLGAGLGAYKAVRPSFFGGNLFPHEEEGVVKSIAVCEANGDIIWLDSNDIQVVKIDGVDISEISMYE